MDDDAPRFMRHDAVPPPVGFWLQASYPPLPAALVAGGLTLAAAVGLAVPVATDAPWWGYLVAGLWSAVMGLIARVMWSTFRAALQPTNWVLRVDDRGLFLKFRSYLNYAFDSDEPDVLFVPRAAVAWLRANRQNVSRTDSDGAVSKVRQHYLDIALADGTDLEPIKAQLRTERSLWKRDRFGRSRHGHYPVSVARGGRLRVAWRAEGTNVRPPLAKALRLLSRWYPLHDAVDGAGGPTAELDRDAQEGRILELAEAGQKIQAIKLTREVYGLSLSDAKAFVEELHGR